MVEEVETLEKNEEKSSDQKEVYDLQRAVMNSTEELAKYLEVGLTTRTYTASSLTVSYESIKKSDCASDMVSDWYKSRNPPIVCTYPLSSLSSIPGQDQIA